MIEMGSQVKLVGLVQRFSATQHFFAFIRWTRWTLRMAVLWWQHLKHCHVF